MRKLQIKMSKTINRELAIHSIGIKIQLRWHYGQSYGYKIEIRV